ncbi:MAG: hypothetical protein AMJ65_18140 [Phycisphaerae bacterium SG8_4]|nr:MAG: hypothetical protein AMJ65_18140 [Phycisphaerae bacterium SG8_4]
MKSLRAKRQFAPGNIVLSETGGQHLICRQSFQIRAWRQLENYVLFVPLSVLPPSGPAIAVDGKDGYLVLLTVDILKQRRPFQVVRDCPKAGKDTNVVGT